MHTHPQSSKRTHTYTYTLSTHSTDRRLFLVFVSVRYFGHLLAEGELVEALQLATELRYKRMCQAVASATADADAGPERVLHAIAIAATKLATQHAGQGEESYV
jgi:hypothetical protein